ncbi:MAG: ABC transporter ATP-binding protein [Candidatus Bathyarchaeia archaeon]
MITQTETALLEVKGLKKHFSIGAGILGRGIGKVYAVDGVNLSILKGETLGLVGESGCGKTTVGRCVLALERPTAGEVNFNGENILNLKGNSLKKVRSKLQIVFQDPYASLNPRWSIRNIIAEPLVVTGRENKANVEATVLRLLKIVGLNEDHLNRFPHEFSGGQRQRIGIARALSVEPELIVLDEPTSSLDVSVQAQILNLLKHLQKEFHLTYLFISHNLSVIKHMSNRIAVMYLGKIVEIAETDELFRKSLHPYTKILLDSIPVPEPQTKRRRERITGDVPSAAHPPSGCRFHPRCPIAIEKCTQEEPELLEYAPRHYAACHLANRTMNS